MAELALDGIRAYFQEAGKQAYLAGRPKHSHGMMRGTAAIGDFLIGYNAAKTHDELMKAQRVELAQEG